MTVEDAPRRPRRFPRAQEGLAEYQVAAAAHVAAGERRIKRRRRRDRLHQRHRVVEQCRLRPARSKCATHARAKSVSLFDTIESSLLLASRDSAVVNAEIAFADGVADLENEGIAGGAIEAAGLEGSSALLTPEQEGELEAYFTDDFGPALNEALGEQSDASSFIPGSAAARYLLYQYVVAGGDDPSAVDDAGDGSAWTAAHAEFHDYLRRLARLSDYSDLV